MGAAFVEAVVTTAGVSARGAACARWKKFHFDGLGTSFSTLTFFDDFSHLPSFPSVLTSPKESFLSLSADRLPVAVGTFARDVRLETSAGRKDLFASSSLSEGLRRPKGIFLSGERPRDVSGMAEGNKVGLFPIGARDVSLLVLCRDTSRLLLLCIGSGLRESSVLLPVPRMTLGASRLRKKSSMSVLAVLVILLLRVDGVRSRLSDVVPALADRPILAALIELPLRPLVEYFP
jgi:hypothetical protein